MTTKDEHLSAFRAQHAAMSTAQRNEHLEILLRQRRHWVDEGHPASRALVDAMRAELEELKADLGVTNEAAFLQYREASRAV